MLQMYANPVIRVPRTCDKVFKVLRRFQTEA